MSTPNSETLREALREVFDPELGYNIVDLGLVYDVAFDGHRATVTMTMTTPGCPASDMIQGGVHRRLASIPEIGDVVVNVVWDPPWAPELMSDEAKAHFGFAR